MLDPGLNRLRSWNRNYGSGSAKAKRCGSGSGSTTLVVKWPDVDLVFCVEAGGEEDPEAEVAPPVEETGKHNISCFFK
jgi:hypothetical protein